MCNFIFYLQQCNGKWIPKTSLWNVVHCGACAGGNYDCKPNTTEDYNKATTHDTGQGEWWS